MKIMERLLVIFLVMVLMLERKSSMAKPQMKCNADGQTRFSEKTLFKEISQNYKAAYRPRRNSSNTVEVQALLGLDDINDFTGKSNVFSANGYFKLYWHDDHLRWEDKPEYSCIDQLNVPTSLVWIPDLFIPNAPDAGGRSFLYPSNYRLTIFKNGTVFYYPNGQLLVKCKIDFTYYPFDEQICSVRLQSPNYNDDQMLLTFTPGLAGRFVEAGIDLDSSSGHPLWEVVQNSTSHDNLGTLHYHIKMRRKPLYYYMNIVAPGFIISAVELVIFVSPIDSDGKFIVAFTCLLSFTVFQSFSSDDLPKSSDGVSLIDLYIYLQMIYICGIIILLQGIVFIFVDLSKVKYSRPPRWLIILSCGKKPESSSGNKVVPVLLVNGSEAAKTPEISDGQESTHKDEDEEGHKQWLDVASCLNRISMVLYILAIVITPFVMFLAIPKPIKMPPAEIFMQSQSDEF